MIEQAFLELLTELSEVNELSRDEQSLVEGCIESSEDEEWTPDVSTVEEVTEIWMEKFNG